MPTVTPRWDLGMVLPITNAAEFLDELKSGQAKWNGVLDFSIEDTLVQIKDKATQGLCAEAQALADQELKGNQQPEMIMAAGMLHFCTGDNAGAGKLFSKTLSMDAENTEARFMLFLIDWLNGEGATSAHREALLAQNMLEKGHTRKEAEKEIDTLLVLLKLLDEVALTLQQNDKSLTLQVNVGLAVQP